MPAPAGSDAGTASQLIPGVRQTNNAVAGTAEWRARVLEAADSTPDAVLRVGSA
jgi:hypothetical protein